LHLFFFESATVFSSFIRFWSISLPAHFHFAKYLDSRLSEVGPTQGVENDKDGTIAIASNKLRHEYLIDSIKHYGVALTLGEKHVFQALPRMLAMWLEFTSQTDSADDGWYESQEQMNKIINSFASEIPEHVFYTALPQLISSVVHANEETSKNVALILRNVLARYPGQAMWSCGWLRFSKNSQKKKAGEVSSNQHIVDSTFLICTQNRLFFLRKFLLQQSRSYEGLRIESKWKKCSVLPRIFLLFS
jgi:hypothetical protein